MTLQIIETLHSHGQKEYPVGLAHSEEARESKKDPNRINRLDYHLRSTFGSSRVPIHNISNPLARRYEIQNR